MEVLHPTQQKLLELSSRYDLMKWGLRRIAKIADIKHPQQVKYHLTKLVDAHYLDKNFKPLKKTTKKKTEKFFLEVPIYGEVNCGVPTLFSEENLQGFIKISKSILGSHKIDSVYALKADGNSMDRSSISSNSINDGDYVLVDRKFSSDLNNKYIVASIDDACTLKKVIRNNGLFKLVAESNKQEDYPPIVVHENDMASLRIEGEVFQVISNDKNEIVYEEISS